MPTKTISRVSFFFLLSVLPFYSITIMAQTPEDSASLYEFQQTYHRTFSTRDPVAVGELYTEDADCLMFNLPEMRGRNAIEQLWRNYWQGKFNKQEPGRKGKFLLKSVRFLSKDVALLNLESTTGGRDSLGNELPTRKARGTWLMQRQNGKWFIAALCGMPTEQDSIVLGASMKAAKILRPHIRAFVHDYEDAFNRHDPSALSAFFRDDADIIVRTSPLIHGKQAIRNWWVNYFSKPRNYRAIFIIDEIRSLGDGIAQVNFTVTGAIPGTVDNPRPLRQTRAMWILVREAGSWRLSAMRILPSTDDRVIRR